MDFSAQQANAAIEWEIAWARVLDSQSGDLNEHFCLFKEATASIATRIVSTYWDSLIRCGLKGASGSLKEERTTYEQLLQCEAYLKLRKVIADRRSILMAFAKKVFRSVAINLIGKRDSRHTTLEDEMAHPSDEPYIIDSLATEELASILKAALENVPNAYLVVMHEDLDMTDAEIASEIGATPKQVEGLRRRAMAQIRKQVRQGLQLQSDPT